MPITRTELLFPPHLIPNLLNVRSSTWRNLVVSITKGKEDSLEQISFVHFIARLANCPTCSTNSFRSTQGCLLCAQQALSHYRGSDEDLLALYNISQEEVKTSLIKDKVIYG